MAHALASMRAAMKPGDPFLGYRLLYPIGAGGISEVWAAQHEFLGHDCALKFLQVQNRSNAGLVQRAKHEAIALARLRHVNLVQVHDAGITPDGLVWMAMPLLKGMNLRDYLARKGRLPALDALRFARDVCHGTRAAHEVGIVHRDLKPENVFLTERHEIVVLDLGVAKFQDIGMRSTGRGDGVLGTVKYMSPEQISARSVDHRSDQYSVGVMLYEMLWGEHPFCRDDDGRELDAHRIGLAHTTREPRPLTQLLPGLPTQVWEVVARAIRKRPEERFDSIAQLAHAIRAVRAQLSIELSDRTCLLGSTEASVPSEPGADRAYLPPQSVPRFMAPAAAPSAKVIPIGSSGAHSPSDEPTTPISANEPSPELARATTKVSPVDPRGASLPRSPRGEAVASAQCGAARSSRDARTQVCSPPPLSATPSPSAAEPPAGGQLRRALVVAVALFAGAALTCALQLFLPRAPAAVSVAAKPVTPLARSATRAVESAGGATSAAPTAAAGAPPDDAGAAAGSVDGATQARSAVGSAIPPAAASGGTPRAPRAQATAT